MEKVYPIDIAGIRNIGVEEWLENYYVPVTGKEYNNIYDKVFKSYMDIIKKYDNRIIYWIAISNIRMPSYVSLYILELLKLIRLKENGYSCIIGQKKEEMPDNVSMVQYSMSKNEFLLKDIDELTSQKRSKNILRTVKYNIKPLFLHGASFIRNISNLYILVGNRYQQEVDAFCDENNIIPVCLPPTLFAKNNNRYVQDFKTSGLIEFISDYLDILKSQYTIIDDLAFECLKKIINERFRLSYSFFCQNIEIFSKFEPGKLLITGLGTTIHRIFSSAWRYAGGEVIGVSHGNTYSNHYSDKIFIELSAVDVFVSTSRGHKEIIRQAVKDFYPELKNCKIIYGENNTYKSLYGRLQNVPPVNKIKKIMVVGAVVPKSYYARDTEYHKFSLLYNDIQMVKMLKKAGYYTIYKPRPDTMHETYDIFEKYADDVLKGKIEDVYKNADCLVFSTPYSTAFGFLLLTNRPIVLLNVKGYPWHPRVFELMKKRCSVVEAKAVDGKIVFDEQDVLNAVQESINNINYDILHEFAF